MKNVQIRDVPDDIHATLVARAESENKSLQTYLMELISDEARKARTISFLRELAAKNTGPEKITTQEIVDIIRKGRDAH